MRPYAISVMVISVITIAFTLIFVAGTLKDKIDPVGDLSASEYKKYLSFDYYKEQEMKHAEDEKHVDKLTSLTEMDWENRWELNRKMQIEEVDHKTKQGLFSEALIILVFSILLVSHIYLYKRNIIGLVSQV